MSILVVDDEKNYLLVLKTLLSDDGFDVITTSDPNKALNIINEDTPDLLITDLKMPVVSGIDLLKAIKEKKNDTPVIMLTAHGSIETAVEAMKLGAYHYILKPFSNDEIKIVVKRAMELSSLIKEKSFFKNELSARFGFKGFIGESDEIKSVLELIEQVSPTKTTVLIHGESGTGKELVARAIYKKSTRSDKPFVAVNCGALTESLLESELFGHEKGAFTGATNKKIGRFEMADGGTLFLDEVGTTSPALQIRLLRVLQEQTFERVGGTKTLGTDVRLITATNQDLAALMEKGIFREDFYYRIKVFTINLPPLRERKTDISPLVSHFLEVYAKEIGKSIESISTEALNCMKNYDWPGNIRELKNVIERGVVISRGKEIELKDLPMELLNHGEVIKRDIAKMEIDRSLPQLMEEFERNIIVNALKKSNGIQSQAARRLGISPANLQYKLNKYNLIQT